MKALVFHGIGDIRVDEVDDPRIEQPTDAVVRLSASAICGTDLHMVRGTLGELVPGTVLGHEGVGVVEEVGDGVRNFKPGDRVVIPSTIACGNCAYCRAGYFSQCDRANPGGARVGSAFYGGPKESGPFHGLQAERARIPFANVGLVKLPEDVSDSQALLLSDIFPTAYFGALLAEITPGDTVAVFGCGPVGQLAIASAFLLGAGRVLAIDAVEDRLEHARNAGAEIIHDEAEDPVEAILALTGGIGVDRAIDAVGVDARRPHKGPAARRVAAQARALEKGGDALAPEQRPRNGQWMAGDGPSLALQWAVEGLAKAGTLSIIGVYPAGAKTFPIGMAMNRNLTLKMGNCHHRKYIPELLAKVRSGVVDPAKLVSQHQPFASIVEAYAAFDRQAPGWVKVELDFAEETHRHSAPEGSVLHS